MLLLGLIFTTVFEVSLTRVIGIVSPIAYGLLFVISVLLIFNVDVGKYLPRGRVPIAKNPWLGAFLYGFFFGAIVIPCNPLFIAVLFTRTISAIGFTENLLRFLFFGIGIGFPLLVIAGVSSAASNAVVGFLTRYRRWVNLAAGVMMLGISTYYLVAVFRVLDIFVSS